MRNRTLKHWFVVGSSGIGVCLCVSLGVVGASASQKIGNVSAGSSRDVGAIIKIERDIGDAMIARDTDNLDKIYADDWTTISAAGQVVRKEKLLHDFKSGEDKLVSFELGPIDVKVLDDLAVAHGTVTEKRIRGGKDVSGQSIYMDLLKKRSGKWIIVSSGGARLKSDINSVAAVETGGNVSDDPKDIEAVRKLGRDMGDAMVATDIDRLSQIFADDWATVSGSGTLVGKDSLLQNIESGKNRLVSYGLGPIDVKLLGDLAVAHGTVTERRIRDGRNVEVQGVYMDLLKRRDGKWVVVRSEGAFANSKD